MSGLIINPYCGCSRCKPQARNAINAIFAFDPAEGRRQVIEALRDADGVSARAAAALGIHRSSLHRIITREMLWPELDKIREEVDQWKRSSKVWRSPTPA